MTIDIIIPTYKPNEKFEKCLTMLKKQRRQANKIILINTDVKYFKSTVANAMSNLQLIHIKKEQFDHGGTRHMGVTLSDADIIVFMTQDAVPADEFLIENLEKAFQDSKVGAAYARQLADPKDNFIEAFTRKFNYPEKSTRKSFEDISKLGIKTFFCSNVCAAYRKTVYMKLGGFPLKTIFNEDMIMASKIIYSGKSIAYVAEAKVWHWHNYTAKEQLCRNFDLAVSQKMYGKPFTEIKSEGEGMKLVLQTMKYLILKGKPYLIPKLMIQSGAKFIGYRLGWNYERLSKKQIKKLTMSSNYWKF